MKKFLIGFLVCLNVLVFILIGCVAGRDNSTKVSTSPTEKTITEHTHSYEYETLREPTCAMTGEKKGKCTVCGDLTFESIPKPPHIEGEWEVIKEPTRTSEGVKAQRCTVCNLYVNEEYFNLSEEELQRLESEFKASCRKNPKTEDLERNPNKYKGERIAFLGRISQVCYESFSGGKSTYRIRRVNEFDKVYFMDVVLGEERMLEDDWVVVYGTFVGLKTYTSVLNRSITVPEIEVEYYYNFGSNAEAALHSGF